jgi:hypothetical protein
MEKSKVAIAAARQLRRQDMDAALSDHEAAKKAQREKTDRLRALRLAKEASDKEIAAKASAERLAAKKKPRTKAAVPTRGVKTVRKKDA